MNLLSQIESTVNTPVQQQEEQDANVEIPQEDLVTNETKAEKIIEKELAKPAGKSRFAVGATEELEEATEPEKKTFSSSRYGDGYEVSSKGDSRFSALSATFAPGTTLFGHDVGGRTIESVYQHGVKQNDWTTDNNKKTGAPNSKEIIKGDTEQSSYEEGYLPLWKEWAKQNPDLISELRGLATNGVLTDRFASTYVSQARALADILNESNDAQEEVPAILKQAEQVENKKEESKNAECGTTGGSRMSKFAKAATDIIEEE